MEIKLPCGDAVLVQRTGRDWAGWCALLDADGAAAMSHQQIAAIVHDKYQGGPWWSQMVTVGYERLRGLRDVGQSRAGHFTASVSRTLPVDAKTALDFFTDADRRAAWLGEAATLRPGGTDKSVRLNWPDGGIVAVFITAKGAAKCSIGLEHGKLTDQDQVAQVKAWWQAALDRLHQASAGAVA